MRILIIVKNIFLHLIRRILQISLKIIVFIACGLIYIVTYEPKTFKRATARKVRRIKKLTKFKVYLYKNFKGFWEFLHDDYLKDVYNNFKYLID